jgi:predicted ATP-dependent protease
MESDKKYELTPEQLRWKCDPAIFDFECTKELAPLREFIGQDRAIRAIEFGLSMEPQGYNIYVAGLAGTGKTSIVKAYVQKLVEERLASKVAALKDWCYVHNFAAPDRPQIMDLPQGKGKAFTDSINGLLERLKDQLTKAFSSEEYQEQRKKLIEQNQANQQRLFEELQEQARQQGFFVQVTPMGPATIPLKNGKPLTQDEYMELSESVRKKLDAKRSEVIQKLTSTFEKIQALEKETAETLQKTDKEIANYTVSRLFEDLLQEYKGQEKPVKYLEDLKSYTLDNLDAFKQAQEQAPSFLGVPAAYLTQGRDPFLPFKVNVFVDNSNCKGPPVIEESNPTFPNMFGKIERRFLFGGYLSDHTMLKPGAMHLANGGYLLVGARDVLMNPGVWLALKRVVKTKEVGIEDPLESFGFLAPQGMRPQPMPLDVKVVLIGDAYLYQMLAMYDEDFWETFRVKADFNSVVDKTKENMLAYAAFVCNCCEEAHLLHFDPPGVAKLVEHTSRMVADQEKLSTRFAQIRELVHESEYWARKDGASVVSDSHVRKAIEERIYRHNLPDERLREMITRGSIMIDTDGAVVGQVNGLSVYMLGDIAFAKPTRITCRTFLGRSGVINIERESHLSGSIHDKGVLIMSGYIGWKYAQDHPLSLSASLCFEQSYEGVEGDSASSAELYALLSSLSEVPIRQDIAATGSVNQKGEAQPIGGVNHKIEGFFEVCKHKGLTGKQGVIIPRQNSMNLMLREDVVEAVRQGQFHIHAVGTVDEGIEILTGREAGLVREDGTYPEESINFLVWKQLKAMAAKLKEFATPAGEEKKPIAT